MAITNFPPSASNTSRWWFLFAFLFLFQSQSFGQAANTNALPVTKHTAALHPQKHPKHRRTILRRKQKPAHIQTEVKLQPQNPAIRNTPKPGHEGDERSDWFVRRRAWPNQTIDPTFYPNALAEAARMPVFANGHRKDGALSVMQWQSIGPYSIDGRVTCIATHPTDSNTFYIGAAAGGLWKTTNHGGSWTCLTDTFGSLSIGCVTLDPTQPQTIYIGLGECNGSADSYPGDGLWRSTDGGNSWQYIGFAAAQYIAKVIIDPRNPEHLFVAIPGPNSQSDTNRGIFHSTDAGASWERSLSGGVSITHAADCTSDTLFQVGFIDIAMNPVNSGELVAAAWDHSMTIGGNFCPGGSGGPNTGIYRSTDTGKTWARIDTLSNGLPNGKKYGVLGRIALLWTMAFSEVTTPDYLFAGYIRTDTNMVTRLMQDENFEGLYRSSDQGMTWTKLLDSTIKIPMGGIQNKDSANITNAQGGYDFFLTAGPVTGPIGAPDIYLGGIDIFRSTDLGQSWKNITDSYSQYYAKDNRAQHSDQHGVAFTCAKSGTDLIAVSDGGVFHTRDYGTTWGQTAGLPITMFYTIAPWEAGMANTPEPLSASDLKVLGGTQDNGTVAHGLTSKFLSFETDSDFAWIGQGDGGMTAAYPHDSNKLVCSAAIGAIFARNTLDSLVPNPLGGHDTIHDTLPRWHTLSYRLLYGSKALTDTNESASFVIPLALDNERPADLYTARCHVYHAVLDWNDLENTKWYRWSPVLAGNANDSLWYYGDIESLSLGVRDAAGNPMLWAGGYYLAASPKLWRTTVDPTRNDTTPPHWVSIVTGLPTAIISSIVPDRSDSMTAFVSSIAASTGPHVLKTTNGGKKWISISSNLPATPVSAIVIDSFAEHGNPLLKNQVMIAGTDIGVYVTTDGGADWAQLGTGLPHSIVSDIAIYKNMLIASTHGRSAWALDISDLQAAPLSVVEQDGNRAPSISIFPNPVVRNESFSVRAATGTNTITTCRLIEEASGRDFDAPLERHDDGSYVVSPGSDLSPGAYIVELFNGNQVVGEGRVSIVQ